jgi:regulator of protease activity HflC (stomatin/prohibitin superfamily)
MRLDEILAPDSPDHPLHEVPKKGLETARKAAEPMGIDVIDMTMGTVDLLKDHKELVGNQMLANWRAEWNRRATVLVAQGVARKMQLTEEARAEAQANMIQALTEGFRIATGDNPTEDVSREVIALRFIDTLEALMQGSMEKGKEKEKETKDKPPSMNLAHLT